MSCGTVTRRWLESKTWRQCQTDPSWTSNQNKAELFHTNKQYMYFLCSLGLKYSKMDYLRSQLGASSEQDWGNQSRGIPKRWCGKSSGNVIPLLAGRSGTTHNWIWRWKSPARRKVKTSPSDRVWKTASNQRVHLRWLPTFQGLACVGDDGGPTSMHKTDLQDKSNRLQGLSGERKNRDRCFPLILLQSRFLSPIVPVAKSNLGTI